MKVMVSIENIPSVEEYFKESAMKITFDMDVRKLSDTDLLFGFRKFIEFFLESGHITRQVHPILRRHSR